MFMERVAFPGVSCVSCSGTTKYVRPHFQPMYIRADVHISAKLN